MRSLATITATTYFFVTLCYWFSEIDEAIGQLSVHVNTSYRTAGLPYIEFPPPASSLRRLRELDNYHNILIYFKLTACNLTG